MTFRDTHEHENAIFRANIHLYGFGTKMPQHIDSKNNIV